MHNKSKDPTIYINFVEAAQEMLDSTDHTRRFKNYIMVKHREDYPCETPWITPSQIHNQELDD